MSTRVYPYLRRLSKISRERDASVLACGLNRGQIMELRTIKRGPSKRHRAMHGGCHSLTCPSSLSVSLFGWKFVAVKDTSRHIRANREPYWCLLQDTAEPISFTEHPTVMRNRNTTYVGNLLTTRCRENRLSDPLCVLKLVFHLVWCNTTRCRLRIWISAS